MTMDVVAVADELAIELEAVGTEDRAVNEKRYLKSELQHYGVTVPVIRKLARRFAREIDDVPKTELLALTLELWDREVYELRKLAVNILAAKVEALEEGDIGFIEGILRRSHTWALIDDTAMNVVAPMLTSAPDAGQIRLKWSEDDDFWVRRTAMLSLLPRLRRGRDGWEEFTGYADEMLDEKEFFIRKAVGWILREVSKHSPDLVFEWLEPRAACASSVTMREAVKYLSADQRSLLNGIRRSGQRRIKS